MIKAAKTSIYSKFLYNSLAKIHDTHRLKHGFILSKNAQYNEYNLDKMCLLKVIEYTTLKNTRSFFLINNNHCISDFYNIHLFSKVKQILYHTCFFYAPVQIIWQKSYDTYVT